MWPPLLALFTASAEEGPERPHVVLVTLDTCRADRIGVYGHQDANTPVLDGLAATGRRYSRAYSPIPFTIPAHASLFTGRSPGALGIRGNGTALAEGEFTLAERMKDQGYVTAASVGAYVTTRTWGFSQGFDSFYDTLGNAPERPGAAVVDDILAWRGGQEGDQPQFVWVHLFDAHSPHVLPPGETGTAYDAEVAELDAQVGRLVEAFDDSETLFVIVSDHGEGLGDHGEEEHGLFIYESTQHVPYILNGPGIEPAVVDETVSLLDVAPTLLDHLGLPGLLRATGRVSPGTPTVPIQLETFNLQDRFGFAPHRGVVVDELKLIDLPTAELYDVVADRGETTNLTSRRAEIESLRSKVASPGVSGTTATDSMLEALGYVAGEPTQKTGPLPDPKDHLEVVFALQNANRKVAEGDLKGALTLLQQVDRNNPEVREIRLRLSQLLTLAGRETEALALLEGTKPGDDSTLLKGTKARALMKAGQHAEAAELLVEIANENPDFPGVHVQAFDALMAIPGGTARAIAFGVARLDREPEPELAGRVGVALAKSKDLKGAQPYLEAGRALDPPPLDLYFFLAQVAEATGQPEQTRGLLESEVRAHPNSAPAVFALAMTLERTGEWQGQLDLVSATLDQADKARAATGARSGVDLGAFWALKARALLKLGREEEAKAAVARGMEEKSDHPALLQLHDLLK